MRMSAHFDHIRGEAITANKKEDTMLCTVSSFLLKTKTGI